MEIASAVTKSALDFFEKPNVLINYEGSYDQEVFPHVECRGPQLDFGTAEAKNFIDLNRIPLSVKVGVFTEYGKTRAKVNEHPIVSLNNTLHTLLSHAELYFNGKLISHSNNCYLHAVFIETDMTTDTEGKETWAKCQGYDYLPNTKEQDQAFNKLYADSDRRKECTAEFYGVLHVNFFWPKKTFGTWSHPSLVFFPSSQQYTAFHERNGWGSESARWQSTSSHWESVSIRQKKGHEQCEIAYRKSTSKKSRHLSLYWKPKQNLQNPSWKKLFCDKESFWNGAHPPINFLFGQKLAFS